MVKRSEKSMPISLLQDGIVVSYHLLVDDIAMKVSPVYVNILCKGCLSSQQGSTLDLFDVLLVKTVVWPPDDVAILNHWSYQRLVKSNRHVVICEMKGIPNNSQCPISFGDHRCGMGMKFKVVMNEYPKIFDCITARYYCTLNIVLAILMWWTKMQ